MRLSRRNVIAGMAVGAAAGMAPSRSLAERAGARSAVNFAGLDARIAGDVLTSGEGYESARRTFSFSPRYDRHPAAIARCLNAQDVARSIAFARDKGLEIAVKSGGHDSMAASTCDGGLLIDMGRMNAISISEDGTFVTVGPGALAGQILQTLGRRDLVTPTGNYAGVGIAGLTLGGGLGPLVASRGATCDNLRRATLVMPDGRTLTASHEENPDLFWALRGGGGNFGIVTELELSAYRLPEVIGGIIVFDGSRPADFLRFFPAFMATAPRELVVDARIVSSGRPLIFVSLCFAGAAADADRALAPLRAAAPVLVDGVRAGPYLAARAPTPDVERILAGDTKEQPAWNSGAGFGWRGASIHTLDEAAIATIEEIVRTAPGANWAFDLGHHMHGAVCEVGIDQSPLPRPFGNFTFHLDAWWADAAEAERGLRWIDTGWTAMQRHAVPSYVNYLSTDDPTAIAAAYGPALDRLRSIKRRYDPDNVLHRNRNIRPA